MFNLKDIIDTYLQSDRNYKTRRGLGRFLVANNKNPGAIPQEVIDDLKKCFEYFKDERGIEEMLKLQNEN